MKYTQPIVTGAPGAGKSAALAAFLRLESQYIGFDIDWLAEAASHLAGKEILFAPETWPHYDRLWFAVLHAVHRNGKVPVFFAPLDARDIARDGQPEWCDGIQWLLLDCDDVTRRERLQRRPGWDDARIAEALADARSLRQTVRTRIDTGTSSPDEVATRIRDWLDGRR